MQTLDTTHYKDKHVLAAVSGGSDSLGMLICLLENGFSNVSVATVDHGLRKEAKSEAAFVKEVCQSLSLKHHTLEVKVDDKGNLQANARDARYQALSQCANALECEIVLIGHTANDVAETFLMNAFRGSGTAGLAKMSDTFLRGNARFGRPVLHLRKHDLAKKLRDREMKWVEDPSNNDQKFNRVRIRTALEVLENQGFDPLRLALTASNLADDEYAIRASLNEFYKSHVQWVLEGVQIAIDETAFQNLPSTIQFWLIGDLVQYFGARDFVPRKKAFLQMKSNLWQEQNLRATLGGCLFERRRAKIFVCAELSALPNSRENQWHLWQSDGAVIGPKGEGALRSDQLKDLGVSAAAYATAPNCDGHCWLSKRFPYTISRN